MVHDNFWLIIIIIIIIIHTFLYRHKVVTSEAVDFDFVDRGSGSTYATGCVRVCLSMSHVGVLCRNVSCWVLVSGLPQRTTVIMVRIGPWKRRFSIFSESKPILYLTNKLKAYVHRQFSALDAPRTAISAAAELLLKS